MGEDTNKTKCTTPPNSTNSEVKVEIGATKTLDNESRPKGAGRRASESSEVLKVPRSEAIQSREKTVRHH